MSVPDVREVSESSARQMLSSAGLTTAGQSQYQYDAFVPEGYVIGCDPGIGTSVEKGTTVTLIVSKGPKPAGAGRVRAAGQWRRGNSNTCRERS